VVYKSYVIAQHVRVFGYVIYLRVAFGLGQYKVLKAFRDSSAKSGITNRPKLKPPSATLTGTGGRLCLINYLVVDTLKLHAGFKVIFMIRVAFIIGETGRFSYAFISAQIHIHALKAFKHTAGYITNPAF
jgi:hypothetical protein